MKLPVSGALVCALVCSYGLGLAGCATQSPCELRGTAEVVLEEGPADRAGSSRVVRWDVAADPVLWTTTRPASRSLEAFRAEARRRVGDVSAAAILRRGIDRPTSERESALARQVLDMVDARVVPMRCFDALFLARQTDRLDMVTTPTEVLAFVLRSADGRRLHIVEYTVNAPGIGRVGPVLEPVEALLAAGGWTPWAVFHNHNFFFEGADWHGGGVAPSAPDAELTAHLRDELGLEEMWITNGFSTLLLPTREL